MKLFFLVSLITFSSFVAAEDEHRRGYHWGGDWTLEQEAEEEDIAEQEQYPAPDPLPSSEEMMKMHPDQIRKLEQLHMDHALHVQTPEAVADYQRIQRVIRSKAKIFAGLTSYNSMTQIGLTTNPDSPTTNQGIAVKRQQRRITISNKLDNNRDSYGLVLFTSKACPYCEVSRSTNRQFKERHDWSVVEVDIDENPQLAARHDISYTPTTMLIKRGSTDSMILSHGVIDVPSLEENAYRAVRLLSGEIEPNDFFGMENQQGRGLDPHSKF